MADLLSAHGIDVLMLSESFVGARSLVHANLSSSPEVVPPSGAATAPPPASKALLFSSFTADTQYYCSDANQVPFEAPFVILTASTNLPNRIRHFDSICDGHRP